MTAPRRSGDRYERSDVSGRFVLRFAIAFVVVATGLAALVLALSRALWPEPPSAAAVREAPPVPGPNLQREPAADLAAMRADARQRLSRFGWVDRDRGIARIPIERAMEMMVARERGGDEQ